MQLTITADVTSAASAAASEIARTCTDSVAARGRALVALSGGETPWLTLHELCHLDLPWPHILVAQVDERVAPAGSAARNLTRLEQILVREGPLPHANLLPMPVGASDLGAAATAYQRRLETAATVPVIIDLVQLGLGTDGHTASLVPGDPVLAVRDHDVAVTGEYHGLRRMTLTLPAINRARRRLWLVTGAEKRERLAELLAGTGGGPAVLVTRADALVVADVAAAGPSLRAGPHPG